MSNLQSTLTIKLVDDVSKPAAKIAAALKSADARVKALAAAGVSDRMGQQLARFGASSADIYKVGLAWKDYASAQKLAASSSGWTREQTSQVRIWENTTIAALRNVMRAERSLVRTQQIAALRQPLRPSHAPVRLLGGGHGVFAGPVIVRGTKNAAKEGAELQSEKVKMQAAGIPAREITDAEDRSAALVAKYTNVKRSDVLESYRELRSVLTHPDETPHMLEPVIKARAAMNAIDRSGALAGGLKYAVKAAEVMGLAQDPKRFEAYLNAFIKAQQVMGGTITPEQQFDLATNFKASAATLSDRFKTTTGISLAQEMRGNRAGVGVDQFVKQIVGGFQGSQHAAAKEFVALGLANKDDFEQTKTGEIKGFKPGRHVAGAKLASSDPDLWVYKHLLPAMEKHGITQQEDQISLVRRLFPSGRAADIVAKLIQQRASFQNHATQYGFAYGTNAISNNQADPFVALNSLTTSLGNFAGTVTSPAMADAARALSSWSSLIGGWGQNLAEFQKNNPMTAKIAGAGVLGAGAVTGSVLTYQLLSGLAGGFGLKGSALALDGSAAALNAAAARLGASSLGGATGPTAGAVAGGSAAASVGGGIAAGLVGVPMVGVAIVGGSTNPREDASLADLSEREKNGGPTAEEKYGRDVVNAAINAYKPWYELTSSNADKIRWVQQYLADKARSDSLNHRQWMAGWNVGDIVRSPGWSGKAGYRITNPPLSAPRPATIERNAGEPTYPALPDRSSDTAAAGQRDGASYREAFEAELRAVDVSIGTAVRRWSEQLGSFSASPVITPKISAPSGGVVPGKRSSLDDVSRGLGRRIDTALSGNFTDNEYA